MTRRKTPNTRKKDASRGRPNRMKKTGSKPPKPKAKKTARVMKRGKVETQAKTAPSTAANAAAGRRRTGERLHLLSVPYEARNLAKWGGARWNASLRRWTYEGANLPHALRDFSSATYSPERWFEDDLNEDSVKVNGAAASGKTRIVLRPHQNEAAAAIAAAQMKGSCGFLLADDVGLGKTYSAIDGIARMAGCLNVLVLTPLSVVAHWRRSIAAHGGGTHRWCVTNYDRAKRLLDIPEEATVAVRTRTKNKRIATKGTSLVDWDVVICDEAHRLKNPTSQRSAAVRNLVKAKTGVAFTLWMSATAGQTPLELAYLAPLLAERTKRSVRELGEFEDWCREHGLHIKRGSFGQWGWERNEDDLAKMRDLLFGDRELGMRRRPQDLNGWPEIQRYGHPVELDGKQRGLYERAWEDFCEELRLADHGTNPTNPMVAALRFRQKASLLRVEQTVQRALDLAEDGYQVAISAQFLDTAQLLAETLDGAAVISGETPGPEREHRRVSFQRGEVRFAVFTVTEGISLHAHEAAVGGNDVERVLLVHDLRWSALDMAQIEGRCHRDGQNAVAYYLFGAETVEERVAEAVIGKLSDMGTMLGDELVGLDTLLDAAGGASQLRSTS
jgi:superfamily II DNA or RNA helicase